MANYVDTLDDIIENAIDKGVIQHFTSNEEISNSKIQIEDNSLVNFGSCSYLGLEFHSAIKEGVLGALQRYGTQFSTSRTYLSLGLYEDLEKALEQMFEKPVIVSASTTLGHLATMPVIIGDNDAVIIDLQVHSSVQMTVQILKSRGVKTFVIPHNDMESLENKIRMLRGKHEKIWYLADGVYSMYGDFAPLDKIESLLNTYKQFHLYIDDAHGMGWTGKNGVGLVRSKIAHHDKMVLATSLNKSFASSGGCIVFPNEEMRRKVRNCGSTLIFSGPIQPPMLGGALASAKLHLSADITDYQNDLKEKVEYTNTLLEELKLPQYKVSESPLFFIPVGLPRITYNIIGRMKQRGFFINAAGFPAVPMKKSGLRFMINRQLSKEDISTMLHILQEEYVRGIVEEGSSLEEVAKAFKLPKIAIEVDDIVHAVDPSSQKLEASLHHSILELDKNEWEKHFRQHGTLTYNNLAQLENIFNRSNSAAENHWQFNYYTIRDSNGTPMLMACFTVGLIKEDMFSSAEVSRKIEEEKRREDPYYLTSKIVMTGTLFSKGSGVFIDKNHSHWHTALEMLIEQMQKTADATGASALMLREFSEAEHTELKNTMLDLGLVQLRLPNNCDIHDLSWPDQKAYLSSLGQKYRYSLRKEILAYEDRFLVSFDKPSTEAGKQYCYELYSTVQQKAYDLNVFKLPKEVFDMMCENESYDIIQLFLKSDPEKPVAVMFSFINQDNYHALIVGLDYGSLYEHNIYKQILYQTVLRAKSLNCKALDLAYTAEMEKKKVGATVNPNYAYVRSSEHLSAAILDSLS